MLVLSREDHESIMIGKDIEVFVVQICHNRVKLGIRAPRSIAVHRKEIFEKIENGVPQKVKGESE